MSRKTKGYGGGINNTFLRHLVNMLGGGNGFYKDYSKEIKIKKDNFKRIDYNINMPKSDRDNRIGIRNTQIKKLI